MADDYFVIGPMFELSAVLTIPPGESFPAPCTFTVTQNRKPIGTALARLEDGRIQMELLGADNLSEREQGEIYKLFSRVCVRLGHHRIPLAVHLPGATQEGLCAILRDDGFEASASNLWIRTSSPFVLPPGMKKETMEDVYRQPFFIPWSFVPREWDVMEMVVPIVPEERAASPLRILDLGCGFGKNATLLENLGFEAYGIDVSPTAVERCRHLVHHPERFVTSTVTALPWDGGSFDLVLDIGCIHCLPAQESDLALQEIARVLTPSGILYSRVFKPRPSAWLNAQPFVTNRFGWEEKEILKLFDRYFRASICKSDADRNYLRCQPKVS